MSIESNMLINVLCVNFLAGLLNEKVFYYYASAKVFDPPLKNVTAECREWYEKNKYTMTR